MSKSVGTSVDDSAATPHPLDSFDRPDMEPHGDTVTPAKRDAIGNTQNTVSKAAQQVTRTTAKIADGARHAYGRASNRAQSAAGRVDPFLKEQPYVALGLAAASALLLGLLVGGRGSKVVHVRRAI